MCDTFVALGHVTRDGSVIFGKNSDREPNEAHELVLIPHATHPKGRQVSCTYISIPQVSETNAVLLSKPFWIWGAEMGANEHGLVIGNEAVFTKVPYDKQPGLIGMDFLRLALERASSADEALEVMIQLLERHGQGGNCGFSHEFYYHNSFLIADHEVAWVFETAGKHWAAQKVRDIRSISNMITIGSNWDRASADLVDYAIAQRWCKNPEEFDFSRCYSDLIYTKFSAAEHRWSRTEALLNANRGDIDLPFALGLLRDHGPNADEKWQPGKGLLGAQVCMHASFGPVRNSQTTGSMVSHLAPDQDTHWMTSTAAPCTSVFKPVWIEAGLPDLGPSPTGEFDERTYWWRHENLHREILRDYASRISRVRPERSDLEKEFMVRLDKVLRGSIHYRKQFSQQCFNQAAHAEREWLTIVKEMPIDNFRPLLDRIAWWQFDNQANRPKYFTAWWGLLAIN